MTDSARWRTMIQKLAALLQANVVWGKSGQAPEGFCHEEGTSTFIPVENGWGLWINDGSLTPRETALLKLLVAAHDRDVSVSHVVTPKQRLLDWLREVDLTDGLPAEPPELAELMLGERVPFCVVTDGAQGPMQEKEVNRVLESFFDGQVWVFPVTERKTFILPLATLILENDETEHWQETLWHWAEGLVELFASELGEDVRAGVHPPIKTITRAGEAWLAIKQALSLGETFHPRQTVSATWGMELERLISGLPQEERDIFLQDIASEQHSWWRDTEIRETLTTFFRMNLNVSESARQMFLHRNTLIYRLDKLKQETGRDARQFTDAMLIRLALLLTEEKI